MGCLMEGQRLAQRRRRLSGMVGWGGMEWGLEIFLESPGGTCFVDVFSGRARRRRMGELSGGPSVWVLVLMGVGVVGVVDIIGVVGIGVGVDGAVGVVVG